MLDSPIIPISLGGVLGANARYLLSRWAVRRLGTGFPYGTFGINVTGSLALGFVLASTAGRVGGEAAVGSLLAVGFLGAYTTFSTFAHETVTLVRARAYLPAAATVVGTVALGLLGAWIGTMVGQAL